jgi:hypothetical protein
VDGADLAPDWAAGAHDGNGLAELEISASSPRSATRRGSAPPGGFRNTARPAIVAAGSDVTMKLGLY